MTYTMRRAIATEAKPLVGLYAESGRGKTLSALMLALGFGGDMGRVVMLETEAGRGEAYADDPLVGGYNVLSLRENFSPKNYGLAIRAAEEAKPLALIIDSASHEWEGVGGVLAMAAENKAKGAKGVLVWQQPKVDHQREFMGRLMQTPIPLVIVCMRAKYPMKEATTEDIQEIREKGKKPPSVGDWIRSSQLEPKQADDILYEMFVHGWIDEKHALHVTKYTTKAMREIFLQGEPISIDTGKRLAAWAAGRPSSVAPARQQAPESATTGAAQTTVEPPAAGAATSGAGEPPVDPLYASAKENAECGTEQYQKFWGGLTNEQRTQLLSRHESLKATAAKVPS